MLADLGTEHGLQAAELGRDREAILWFAHAARVGASDPQRTRANVIRAQAWSRSVPRPLAVVLHPEGVPRTLEFHPDRRYLLTSAAPYGGVTAVWDVPAEQPLALPGDGRPTTAAWSPAGDGLALGSRDGVTIYRFPALDDPQHIVNSAGATLLRFSRDGNRLAIATGAIVQVWDRRTGGFVGGRLEHPALVLTLEFTRDGDRLVSACDDGRFRVFALEGGLPALELTGRHQQFGFRWTLHPPWLDPTGTRLISVTTLSELTWWDLTTGTRVGSLSSLGGQVCDLEPSPDGSLLAVTVENLGIALLDPATRRIVSRLHRGKVGMLFSAFRPDGHAVVVGGADPEAEQWKLPEGTPLKTPAVEATGFRAAAFSQDGQLLATAGYENQVRVWAFPRPDPRAFAVRTGGVVGRGTFSADSQLVLVRQRGLLAQVYSTEDRAPSGPSLVPDGSLIEAALTPDGRMVVTAAVARGGGGVVDVWDRSSGRRRSPSLGSPAPPITLAVAANGRVAILYRDGLLRLLDGPTGQVLQHWQCGATEQPSEDVGVCLDRAGRTVLVAINGQLQVWDAQTGRLRFDPPRHPDLLYAIFSADGRLIASAGADSALRLWSAETGAPRGPALVHPSWIDSGIDFHPDSRHVLTICKDMALRVWDVTTGQLAAPPLRPATIGAARFGPDGRVIVSAGYDGTVEVWDWRAGRHLLPARKLPLVRDWGFNGNRSVQISPDGHRVAVGGRPDLHILSLADLDAIEAGSPDELIRRAELLCHHRVHEGGLLAHLTGDEWLRRWRDRRHSGTLQPLKGAKQDSPGQRPGIKRASK
jgi:WD40 repeat protein